MFKRTAVTPEPGLDGLIAHELGVLVATPSKHHDKDPGLEHLAGVDIDNLGSFAEIDLCGLSGGELKDGGDTRGFVGQDPQVATE